MKVALLIDRFQPEKGGAEAYLAEFAEFLLRNGDEPVLFSMDSPGGFPGRCVTVSVGRLPRGWKERAFSKRCRIALLAEGCDVSLAVRHVIAADIFQPHGGAVEAAWRAREESCSKMKRWVHSVLRPLDWKRRALLGLERGLVAQARLILPVSERSAEEFRFLYPEASEKIRTHTLGVESRRFSPAGERRDFRREFSLSPESKIALFVAHDFELKGLESTLLAVDLLRRRSLDLHLFVFGRGKDRDKWKRRAIRLGVDRGVHFQGEEKDLSPAYRGADLLLHPTFYDPCSRVVLEALSCGLPVVTTRRNGACERARSGLKILDDPRDHESLARSVTEILSENQGIAVESHLLPGSSDEDHFRRIREEMGKLVKACPS